MSEDSGGVRLSKRVAELKACSRAEAERYIEGGWVSVNGEVVELPQHRVAETDTVAIAPDARALPLLPATVLWHKPAGVRCDIDQAPKIEWLGSAQRSPDDRSGQRLLLKHWAGLRCVAPLDTVASGLVVFSQSQPVQRHLVADAITVEHELWVDVNGPVGPEALAALQRQVRASVNRQNEAGTRLRVAAKGLRKGQLATWCEAAGIRPDGVHRARLGRLALGTLAVGQWRLMMGYERF